MDNATPAPQTSSPEPTAPVVPAVPTAPVVPAVPAAPVAPVVPAMPQAPATITYDDFAKVQLRIATIVEATVMEKSKRLLKLQVDLGGERRQVLAGIKENYTPEQLVGKQVIVVSNLAPRPMMGEVSHGMLLAATDAVTGKIILMAPSEPVTPGSVVK